MQQPSAPPRATAPMAQFLRTVPCFENLNELAAEQLAAIVDTVDYPAGMHIVRRGDRADAMYVVREGRVLVPIFDDAGRHQFDAQLARGAVFGEMALLTGEPRSADVVASTDCTCVRIPRSVVEDLMRRHPDVAGFLTAILGERLMQAGGIRQVGKYRLVGELGAGGMCRVFEGIHPQLDRPVAIKMLSHALVYRRHFAERFRNEARVIAGLRHPNIVDVYDAEEAYATFFIIMEKLAGLDLEQILGEQGRLEPSLVRRIVRDVASALDYAHGRGIVHRDVKPSNIFIDGSGRVKLTDFGIASIHGVEETMSEDAGLYLGTPIYSSPEHALGDSVDGRSDIYALGIVAYEMLTGRPPFEGESATAVLLQHVNDALPSPRVIDPGIPRDLEAFVARACAKDPADRYQTCREIVAEIDAFERRVTAAQAVKVRTLTFVFPPELEGEVDQLVATVDTMAAGVTGLVTYRS